MAALPRYCGDAHGEIAPPGAYNRPARNAFDVGFRWSPVLSMTSRRSLDAGASR